MSKAVIVGRPINGISLNGLEWLLDNEDAVMIFDDEPAAVEYLKGRGFTEEDLEEVVIRHSIGTCFRCGSPLFPSQIDGYTSQCFSCDEDFFSFEQDCEGLNQPAPKRCTGYTRKQFALKIFDSKEDDRTFTVYSDYNEENDEAEYAYELKVIQFADSRLVIGNYWGGSSPFCADITDDADSTALEAELGNWLDLCEFGETVWVENTLQIAQHQLLKEQIDAILVELDYKGSYSRFALTPKEFEREYPETYKNFGPIMEANTDTIKPMVHISFAPCKVMDESWKNFFTDMASGLPGSDVQRSNLAYIDTERFGKLGCYPIWILE